ncbi:hypothetical protein C5167_027309 [Papaver somniferum]|uniref:uncharacterized protein LOC113339906 n=1 Tax=Papaver somniferum TaxID=3469 RepID=UPI000E6FDA50|nr:uncharacterized protein LOC113339906 [Papaver somniferum]RZC91250.1 hypothetical protein C5167_027309 [Papaver somniferum]
MAGTSLIFSLALAGLIMLSISHVALGVGKLPQVLGVLGTPVDVKAPGDLASVERKGQDQSNLDNGKVNRGGSVDLTAAKGLVVVKDSGGVDSDLKDGKVTQGPKCEQLNIANGAVTVKRCSVVTVDPKNGKVITDAKTEANILGVAHVIIPVPIGD